MVALCMAQHQTSTYNNWTAFITLDWDWHGSILHRPSVQPVHRGRRSNFGGTSVKAVHALLCENSCLHWQSSTSCPAWIRPNHQPPFPEWWDNLLPTVQKTARQQHDLFSWDYSHQSGTELLPTRWPSTSWCGSLLWLNVHIMNLLWSLSDKGTRVCFCRVPSHCGIDGNERVDQLAEETLDQGIDPLASVHYTDMKPLINSYIPKLFKPSEM